MGFLLPLLVALIPLLITPGLLFHYDSLPKVALLVLIVALALLRPNCVARDVAVLWSTKAGKCLCVLSLGQVLWSSVATLASSRPLFSLLGSNWRRFGLLTTMALAIFAVLAASELARRPRSIVYALRATAVCGDRNFALCRGAIFQYRPSAKRSCLSRAGWRFYYRSPALYHRARRLSWVVARDRRILFVGTLPSGGLCLATGWPHCHVALCNRDGVDGDAVGSRCHWIRAPVSHGYVTGSGSRKHILLVAAVVVAFAVFYVSPGGEHLRARVRWSTDEVPGGARPSLARHAEDGDGTPAHGIWPGDFRR